MPKCSNISGFVWVFPYAPSFFRDKHCVLTMHTEICIHPPHLDVQGKTWAPGGADTQSQTCCWSQVFQRCGWAPSEDAMSFPLSPVLVLTCQLRFGKGNCKDCISIWKLRLSASLEFGHENCTTDFKRTVQKSCVAKIKSPLRKYGSILLLIGGGCM